MNKEEYDKASTFDKIDYDIAMKSYFEHNDKIASINDHLGEIYGYSDLKDAEECELKDEIRMYRDALKEKCDLIDKAIASIELGYVVFCEQDKECLINFRKNILKILKGEE